MVSTLRRAIALMLVVLALGLVSCGGDRDVPVVLLPVDETQQTANPLIGAIAEVSPPERIQQLKPYLDVYEPQVRIARPDPDETVNSTTVQVDLQVRDLSIYKEQNLGFGPHLHLFLDDQPHQAIYDVDAPIILENLSPGTHTLRLLAVRPWGESFKNAGAYDQVTFNVFAASVQNNPDDSRPVLTYNQPQDRYGAEPILLDFHLHNAPPHLVAQADENLVDWQIRCTINGESFVFDRWQPIYLKGFKPGKNWIKLELIDETGNLIDNALNSSIRVIDYQPGGEDGLSKLVRGEIPLDQAKGLVDPNYEPPALTVEEPAEPEAVATPATAPEPETPAAAQELKPAPSRPATESISEPAAEPEVNQETGAELAPATVPEPTAAPSEPSLQAPTKLEEDAAAVDQARSPKTDAKAAAPQSPASEAPASSSTAAIAPGPPAAPPGKDETTAAQTRSPEASPERDRPDQIPAPEDDSQALPPRTPERPLVHNPESPVTTDPKSSLNGVAADDLTADSPLMESPDPNFPQETAPVEPPLPPEAGETPEQAVPEDPASEIGGVDEVPEPPPTRSPDTNLKTLEDNADLI